jgi:hypothetical protein
MNNPRALAAAATTLLLMVLAGVAAETQGLAVAENQGVDIAAANWRAGDSVTQLGATPQDVARFLWPLIEGEGGRAAYRQTRTTNPAMPALPVWVGDFQWVDLDRDGQLELVATVSTSPNGTFYQLVVVSRANGASTLQKIWTAYLMELDGVIRDLGGDGQRELVVPTEYARGSGAHRVFWPVVYRLSDGKLIDVSEQHPSVYASVITEVKSKIASLDSRLATAPQGAIEPELLAGLQMTLDRAMRMTGQDPEAPSRRAAEWIHSSDLQIKEFALIAILTNPGPSSAAQLQALAANCEGLLRERVESALKGFRESGRIP